MALTIINAATVERLAMEVLTGAGLTVLSDLDKDPAEPAAGDPETTRSWIRLKGVSLEYAANQQNDGDTQTARAVITVVVVARTGETAGSMYAAAAAAHAVVKALTGAHRAATGGDTTRLAVRRIACVPAEIADEERALSARIVTAEADVSRVSGDT